MDPASEGQRGGPAAKIEGRRLARIVRFHRLGGPEVLQFDETELGDAAPGELKIRVEAIGLNRMEAIFRTGALGEPITLPAVLGSEGSGVIEQIGAGVGGFAIGQRIATIPGFTTVPGFAAEPGRHECAVYGEQAFVPADMAVPLPDALSFAEGASVWMALATAYSGLVDLVPVRPGQTVLVTAVSSPVGIAAAQIVALLGGTVIGTTRTPAKIDALRAQGIEQVVVTGRGDVAEQLRERTGGRGVDLVFDSIAGSAIATWVESLAPGGQLILYGVLDGAPAVLPVVLGIAKALTIRFATQFCISLDPAKRSEMVRFVLDGLASGALRPVIDRIFPFEEIVAAHHYLDANAHVGKIVVTVGR